MAEWHCTSAFSISNGRDVVTRLLVRGVPGYLLWRWSPAAGKALLDHAAGCFDTAEAAIARCETEAAADPAARPDAPQSE